MFFPIKDDQPTVRSPHVTIALILVNSAIFLFTKTLGFQGYQEALVYYGYIPDIFLNSGQYLDAPQWLWATPFTSMFLHGGWMHLIGNMLFLWIYGNNIEDYFGPVRFLLFYLVSGISAVALYTLFNHHSQVPLVGAWGDGCVLCAAPEGADYGFDCLLLYHAKGIPGQVRPWPLVLVSDPDVNARYEFRRRCGLDGACRRICVRVSAASSAAQDAWTQTGGLGWPAHLPRAVVGKT
jgi:hypothetical protein